jgi:tripartite-type tricarboxylate transporter receptor subunit TctC
MAPALDLQALDRLALPIAALVKAAVPSLVLVLASALLSPAARAADATDFYRGKTITLISGSAAGGAYDAYARLLARHVGKHIPGTPSVVVQDMPGAGSLTAVHYLDGNGVKDGTVLVTFNPTLVTASITTPDQVGVTFTDLAWIGSITHEFRVCYAWHTTGIRNWDEVKATKEFVIGATGTGTANYVNGAILRNLFGVRVRQVLGYAGAAQQRLAIERGEIDGSCSEWTALPPDWIEQKKAVAFVRWLPTAPADFTQDAPYVGDLASNADDKRIIEMLVAPSILGNPFAASKQVPAERLALLRSAFDATMRDPDFLAEAARQKMPVEPTDAATADKIIAAIYASATPALIARAKEAMK